jgi:Ras-related GTP-binding protein C/D
LSITTTNADGGRAGKSSCIKTVFQQLPVKDVPFIGITHKIEAIDYE